MCLVSALQVIIVQWGGRAFSTAPLSLEQWLWCSFWGLGVLVWGQLVTTIPTKSIPKHFTWGSGPPEEIIDATSSLVEDGSSGSLSQEVKRTGQILWIRGLTRLQTQVCLIQLHNKTVAQAQHQAQQLKRLSVGSPTSPTASTSVASALAAKQKQLANAGAASAAATSAAAAATVAASTSSSTKAAVLAAAAAAAASHSTPLVEEVEPASE